MEFLRDLALQRFGLRKRFRRQNRKYLCANAKVFAGGQVRCSSLTRAQIMKKIVLVPADIALRTLDPEGVRRMRAWFTCLKRWDTDEVVRKNSEQLPGMPGIYMMRTTTDIRIFFRIDGDTVTVLDITKKAAILINKLEANRRGQLKERSAVRTLRNSDQSPSVVIA